MNDVKKTQIANDLYVPWLGYTREVMWSNPLSRICRNKGSWKVLAGSMRDISAYNQNNNQNAVSDKAGLTIHPTRQGKKQSR